MENKVTLAFTVSRRTGFRAVYSHLTFLYFRHLTTLNICSPALCISGKAVRKVLVHKTVSVEQKFYSLIILLTNDVKIQEFQVSGDAI